MTRKKLADRQDLRTLLCIFGCCLVSSFGFQKFIKLQDVEFVKEQCDEDLAVLGQFCAQIIF